MQRDKTIFKVNNEGFDFSSYYLIRKNVKKNGDFFSQCLLLILERFTKKLRNTNVNLVNVYCIIIHNIYILARQLDKMQR